ncbi:MAG: aspartate/glutamate racemase family protein [Beijerinckiaceae bacterium]
MTDSTLPTIGVVTPNAQGALQPEAREIFAGRVNTVTEGINVERLALDGYQEALARLPVAVHRVVAAGAQAIVVNGTSLSFAFGREAHDQLVANVEAQSGLPATTMAASLVAALQALGAKNVVLATAYEQSVSDLLGAFLASHAISSQLGACLGVVENEKLRSLQSQDIVELVLRAAEGRRMDAVVVSCGNLRTIPLTAMLEERLGVPVVSSALVGVWGALQLVGADTRVSGAGRLFNLDPAFNSKARN